MELPILIVIGFAIVWVVILAPAVIDILLNIAAWIVRGIIERI
jgi:hypothetical protein